MRQITFTVRLAQWMVRGRHFRQFALVLAAVLVLGLVVPGFETFGMPSLSPNIDLDLHGHLYVPGPPPVVEPKPVQVAVPVSEPVVTSVQSSSLPRNVEQASDGSLYPEPGYIWVNPESSLAVRWQLGVHYTRFGRVTNPHVSASESEGDWHPDPGYVWVNNIPGDLSVRWTPGEKLSNDNPHIIAGDKEGSWFYAPGYTNLDDSGQPLPNGRVRWCKDLPYFDKGHLTWPHVISSSEEGYWRPEPGYSWQGAEGDYHRVVSWSPGTQCIDDGKVIWPHVIACDKEGTWQPESGYEWARLTPNGGPPPGNLAVVPVGDPRSPTEKRKALRQHWTEYLKTIQASNDDGNWQGPQ